MVLEIQKKYSSEKFVGLLYSCSCACSTSSCELESAVFLEQIFFTLKSSSIAQVIENWVSRLVLYYFDLNVC